MNDDHDHESDHHDRGLALDRGALMTRRRALTLLGGASIVAAAAACGSSGSDGASSGTTTTSRSASSGSRSSSNASGSTTGQIPEETGGPFPGDGSNGPDVLTERGVVRSDITSSFGSANGVAAGVPLAIRLNVLSVSAGGQALSNAAVYAWHCDRDGNYSLYSQGVTSENYLRGVQETDAEGNVTFASIFPACYPGRWPHIHFEVYESLDAATSGGAKLRTSQLALPKAPCESVYASDGYEGSIQSLAGISLASDNVFSDGYSLELGSVTGSVENGLTVTLAVPV